MRKASTLGLLALVTLIGTLTYTQLVREPLYHSQGYVFGTLVDISIYGESDTRAEQLSAKVLEDFQKLHELLHPWKLFLGQASELAKINTAFSLGQSVPISEELAGIITDSQTLSLQTQGLFNPAIGHLINTWGFQRDEFSPVAIDAFKIHKLVADNPSMSDIVIKNHTISSSNKSVNLDLGGYAKGYALDQAAKYLRKEGVKHALINIGGNIIAIGKHGDQPWHIGIQHPRQPTAIATVQLADGWAIGSSGDYQRYFISGKKRYCHIIDPRSGYPVDHTQSVTVLIPPGLNAGVISDVASKPIFIEKLERRKLAAKNLGIDYYMIIDDQGNIAATSKMMDKLNWLSEPVQNGKKLVTLP